MANFGQLILTAKGIKVQYDAQAGKPLKFKRIGMGSGKYSGNISALEKLVDEKVSVAINKGYMQNESYVVEGFFSNQGLTTGFAWREIGLFAEDQNGNEVLYCYANAGDTYDYIPATEDERYSKYIRIATAIGNANDISIIESEGILYVDTLTFQDAESRIDITGSESGNVITLTDSTYAPFNNITVYGKSVQDGTPTPDAPIDIESVGDGGSVTVKTTGKNLCPPCENKTLNGITLTKINNGGSSLTGTVSGSSFYTIINVDIPAGKYVFSANNPKAIGSGGSDSPYIAFRSEDNTWMSDLALTSINMVRTFTANQPIKSILFAVPVGVTLENFEVYFQLENEFSSTEYEPYKESTATIPLVNPMCGIPVTSGGNYTDSDGQQWICDEIDLARCVYVHMIYSDIFDGSSDEQWSLDDTQAIGNRYGVILNNVCVMSDKNNGINSMNSSFPIGESGATATTKNVYTIIKEGNMMYVSMNGTETLEEFKSYLAESPMELKAVLKTPIETAITDEQLTALRSLQTFEPITNIFADDLANMDVEYFKNNDNGKSVAILKQENIELRKLIGDVNTVLESLIGGA